MQSSVAAPRFSQALNFFGHSQTYKGVQDARFFELLWESRSPDRGLPRKLRIANGSATTRSLQVSLYVKALAPRANKIAFEGCLGALRYTVYVCVYTYIYIHIYIYICIYTLYIYI